MGFFCILYDVIDLITKSRISQQDITYLRQLIKEHNELYVTLFNEGLKPKFHFIIHYPTCIESIGPLKYLSCEKYEAFVTDEPWWLLGRPRDTTQLQIASCYSMRKALASQKVQSMHFAPWEQLDEAASVLQWGTGRPTRHIASICSNRNIRTPFWHPLWLHTLLTGNKQNNFFITYR